MREKSNNTKGREFETWVRKDFERSGWRAAKQVMSGALWDRPGDVRMLNPYEPWVDQREMLAECKAYKHGFRTGDKALETAGVLMLPFERLYMRLQTFFDILKDCEQRQLDRVLNTFSTIRPLTRTYQKAAKALSGKADFFIIRPDGHCERICLDMATMGQLMTLAGQEGCQ